MSNKGFISKGTKVTYSSDARSYTLPASAIGVLVFCSVRLGSSATVRTIKAPSGGEYIVSGCYESINESSFTSLFTGGATVISGHTVGVSGFYMRIS